MSKYTIPILILFLLGEKISYSQQNDYHLTEIKKPIYIGTSKPLKEMPKEPAFQKSDRNDNIVPNKKYLPPIRTTSPTLNKIADSGVQTKEGIMAAGDILFNMEAINNLNGFYPPDVSGDVGPNHYMMMVNSSYQIWNKTGTSLLGPKNLSTIWSGMPSPLNNINDGDPIVLYDGLADRWFASQFALPNYPAGPFYELVAVSTSSDPTGSWYTYAFQFSDMNDYPKVGVWPDGYYMSANLFASHSGKYAGGIVCVLDRISMLSGSAATMQVFNNSNTNTAPWSFLPSHCSVGSTPPVGAPNYFIWSHDDASYGGSDQLQVYQFHTDWTTPTNSTFTGPFSLNVTPFNTLGKNMIPQPGTTVGLDNLSDRLMQRLQYRNFGSYEAMVVCQTIDAGSTRAGIRWYDLHKTTGNWSLYQEGTYAPADGLHRWMGSISMDESENIALGYSVSSSTVYPSIRFTGRLATDPLNNMLFAEKTIVAGTGYQNGTANRWGDYTSMCLDPDGLTFWYADEYIQTTGGANWQTRVASFKLSTILPVEMTSFTAAPDNKLVKIKWRTETEVKNLGFDIERRVKAEYKDDNSGWTKIGFVPGNGTSNKPINYSYNDNIINKGTEFQYRLKQIDQDGAFHYTIALNVSTFPSEFNLSQNYPNPFNPSTSIRYSLPSNSNVKISLYNSIGEMVSEIFSGENAAGIHELNFNASSLSSGIYFYRLQANTSDGKLSYQDSKKMAIIK
jgi:hypothetical protein